MGHDARLGTRAKVPVISSASIPTKRARTPEEKRRAAAASGGERDRYVEGKDEYVAVLEQRAGAGTNRAREKRDLAGG